ncbi:MAG: PqiC family protein [Burkholderiaceae bacterium]
MTPKMVLACALVVAVELSGCASSPTTNFYTLSTPAAPAQPNVEAVYTVAIGRVTLPDGIDRPQLVVRTGTNQVSIADFERWAGAPKDEIARAIADNLRQQLKDANVFASSQPTGQDADYTVLIDVQRFDSVLGESASVDVLWRVRAAKGHAQTGRSTVRQSASGAGYDAVVEALSRALAAVSRDIADGIRVARRASK